MPLARLPHPNSFKEQGFGTNASTINRISFTAQRDILRILGFDL